MKRFKDIHRKLAMGLVHKYPANSGFKSFVCVYWSKLTGSIHITEETEDGEFIGGFKATDQPIIATEPVNNLLVANHDLKDDIKDLKAQLNEKTKLLEKNLITEKSDLVLHDNPTFSCTVSTDSLYDKIELEELVLPEKIPVFWGFGDDRKCVGEGYPKLKDGQIKMDITVPEKWRGIFEGNDCSVAATFGGGWLKDPPRIIEAQVYETGKITEAKPSEK